jgi:hypothetical protein
VNHLIERIERMSVRGGFDHLSTEERCEMAKRAQETIGDEGQRARAALRLSNSTPEQRHATANKGWETRRKTQFVALLRFNLLSPRLAS